MRMRKVKAKNDSVFYSPAQSIMPAIDPSKTGDYRVWAVVSFWQLGLTLALPMV